MSSPGEYEIPLPELEQIWHQDIKPILFATLTTTARPLAGFVGAQPGAGKSRAMRRLEDLYPDRTFVPLDSDELRKFHPRLDDILATNPARMPVLTNQAASAWFRMGLAQARAQRCDVLIENSFHNADIVLAEAQRFKDAGYQTHAIALAVPSRDSRLGALTRYVDALAAGETARWTNLASHQAGYTGVPATVAALESSPTIDRITVTDRAGQIHYDHPHDPGRWPDGRRILDQIRDTPPTPEEAQAWLDSWTAVTARISELPTFDNTAAQPLLEALNAVAYTLTDAAETVSKRSGSPFHRFDAMSDTLDSLGEHDNSSFESIDPAEGHRPPTAGPKL